MPRARRRRDVDVVVVVVVTDTRSHDDLAVLQPFDFVASQTQIVIDHHGVGIVELTIQVRLLFQIQDYDLRMPVRHTPLARQRLGDKIRQDDSGEVAHGLILLDEIIGRMSLESAPGR